MTASKLRFGILGATGRMGQKVLSLIENEYSREGAVVARAGQSDSLESLLEADVVIDFSLPEGTLRFAEITLAHEGRLPALVSGTTGLDSQGDHLLRNLSEKTAVFRAPNFSAGVFALGQIIETFRPLMEKLGYRPRIVETHHIHKKDKPSGTALRLQKQVSPSAPTQVPTECLRDGEAIGEHAVIYDGKADSLVLQHTAHDRSIFARGAVDAAIWLARKREAEPGLTGFFGMEDYLL